MSIYSDWTDFAQSPRNDAEHAQFWTAYFDIEKTGYEKILSRPNEPYKGKFSELAAEFGMEKEIFCGFIDGINTSLAAGEYDLEALTEDSDVDLTVDMKKLYFNMLSAKAEWLYTLPMWEGILSENERKEITKEYRASSVFVSDKTAGRNDPCPCGSGKKFKKCCGANL